MVHAIARLASVAEYSFTGMDTRRQLGEAGGRDGDPGEAMVKPLPADPEPAELGVDSKNPVSEGPGLHRSQSSQLSHRIPQSC